MATWEPLPPPFFFENAYLELLWVHDETAVREAFMPMGLDMQPRMTWRETTASLFGLTLRRRPGSTAPLPFPTQQLKAEWMPEEVFVDFAADALTEPYYGIVPESLAYTSFKSNIPDLPHALGVKRLSGVRITIEDNELSSIASLLSTNGVATIEAGTSPLMELTFDDGVQGKTVDVRPTLPLKLVG